MGDKIVKSKNLCCQPVVFTRCSLLSFIRERKFESTERKFKTQNPRLSCYSEANKVYHPIQRNTTIQFKVPTSHDSIPWDSDTLDTFKKLHVTCIHVRWDQKDAKSSRLLCIARNPNDVTPPIITGNSLSEVLIFASINPKYDDTLIVELQVQYKKTTSSVHVGTHIKLL
jgi:hypothetical protein